MSQTRTEQTPLELLQQVYGYTAFRGEQAAVIDGLIAGQDSLVIMPTGGGKSICYQIPGLIRPGLGIVISPLIALMQDQVSALTELGVRAAYLNSSLSRAEAQQVEQQLYAGEIELLYVAPERLLMPQTLNLLQQLSISLIAIDEAHCVSQWGHDFRPEYMKLAILADEFPQVPRVALTATADARTQDEIVQNLALSKPARFVAGFDRPNIQYRISSGPRGKERLGKFLANEHPNDAGIIYCLSRNKTEQIAAWLCQQGREAIAYHAGLSAEERAANQARFLREEQLIVVATIAFGMGIDKPDVRFVAHLNLPKSVEAYYQETGRAGRDGDSATAWMNYDLADVVKLRGWIEDSNAPDLQKRVERHKLDALLGLCEMTSCRRQGLLSYFGEHSPEPCGNCDNCLFPPETYDGTEVAQKALSCVYRTGQRFGAAHVIDVLRGADTEKIRQFEHSQLSTYAIGKDLDNKQWRSVMRQLITQGLLAVDHDAFGGLKLTAKAKPLLKGETSLQLRRETEAEPGSKKSKTKAASQLNRGDQALFDALREERKRIATELGKPPYVIFHDKTLYDMVQNRPSNLAEFAELAGVGSNKLEQYGEAFLSVVAAHPVQATDQLNETTLATLSLLEAGEDAKSIAKQRGLNISTIYGHLAECIQAGSCQLEQVLSLAADELAEINAAISAHVDPDEPRLKPLAEALNGRYDYGLLKCLVAAHSLADAD